MSVEWWAALPPDVQAFLSALGTDILKGWARELVNGLVKAIGRQAARPFKQEPRQKALEEALEEALGQAIATLPLEPNLADHYRSLFGDFLRREGVQRELSLIIAPRPGKKLDLTLLRDEFKDAGYDPDRMPGLDFDRFIATLVSAFYNAAAHQPELQGVIEIGLLRDLAENTRRAVSAAEATAAHTAVLPEIRNILRERLGPAAPPHPPGPIRTHIPAPGTDRLVGRAEELAWVCERLKGGDTAAIVGVRGIGGIGKTELAIATARKLEPHFEGRVLWLDCGPNDAHAIQARIGAALGVTLEGDDLSLRADTLARVFRAQPPILVVLDDIRKRHLEDLRYLLPPHPPCALLITSRRRDLPLPPQAVRDLDVLPPQQALEVLADLLPTEWLEAEPEVAQEVIEAVERIPLALKLAARRAHTIAGRKDATARIPLTTLLTELKARRLQVLDQGEDPKRPDLSVVVTFDLSYEDLREEDQARLRRLGAFARNEFPLAALQAVWGDEERAARRALARLVDGGLLEETGKDTWGTHDLLREYAAGRLQQAGEEAAARLAHARYWQQYLTDLELIGEEDRRKREACRPEVEEAARWLMADWGCEPKLAAELALAIAEGFEPYELARWTEWVEAGLGAARAAGERNTTRRLQRRLAACRILRGEVERGRELLEASLTTARELLKEATTEEQREAAERGVAVTLGDIARLKAQSGDVAGALALHQERLAIFERLGDVRSRAVTLGDIARLKAQSGDVAGALALHQEELETYERLGDVRERAVTLGDIARLKAQSGDVAGALALHQEMLAIFERLGDVRERAVTLFDLADLHVAQGEYDEAKRLYRRSLEISRRINDAEGVHAILARLGTLALARGRRDEAIPLLQEARHGFERLGFAPWVAHIDQLLAQAGAQMLALDNLLAMVRAARQGDEQAGQQVWAICEGLARSGDDTLAALGRGLQEVLSGIPPQSALASLPNNLRDPVLKGLRGGEGNASAHPRKVFG